MNQSLSLSFSLPSFPLVFVQCRVLVSTLFVCLVLLPRKRTLHQIECLTITFVSSFPFGVNSSSGFSVLEFVEVLGFVSVWLRYKFSVFLVVFSHLYPVITQKKKGTREFKREKQRSFSFFIIYLFFFCCTILFQISSVIYIYSIFLMFYHVLILFISGSCLNPYSKLPSLSFPFFKSSLLVLFGN